MLVRPNRDGSRGGALAALRLRRQPEIVDGIGSEVLQHVSLALRHRALVHGTLRGGRGSVSNLRFPMLVKYSNNTRIPRNILTYRSNLEDI